MDIVPVDWEKCLFCQTDVKGEKLQLPYNCTNPERGCGYVTLELHLLRLHAIRVDIPMKPKLFQIDDGHGIATTLSCKKAKWHKLCRLNCNEKEVARAEKRALEDIESPLPKAKKTCTRSSAGETYRVNEDRCIICDADAENEPLFKVCTKEVDDKLKEYAQVLQDAKLLARVNSIDLRAHEAKYHHTCITKCHNQVRSAKKSDSSNGIDKDEVNHGIALAELVSYLKEKKEEKHATVSNMKENKDKKNPTVFILADLVKLYDMKLQQLGTVSTKTNSTRLKDRILAQFSDLTSHTEGRNVLLAFEDDVGVLLKQASEKNYDDEAMYLAKAASIIRRDIFAMDAQMFQGSFTDDCQEKSIPSSLKGLVEMIISGTNIDSVGSTSSTQAVLSIAELIQFNSIKSKGGTYLSKHRETPLPLYVALIVYAKTRKKGLIDILHRLGLSVSYRRLLHVTTGLANMLIAQYEMDGVVCPSPLQKGLFTVGAYDNIDHNPSSTTSKESFHGTGISIFQHVNNSSEGQARPTRTLQDASLCTLQPLPLSYADVPPGALHDKDPSVPPTSVALPTECLSDILHDEHRYPFYFTLTSTKNGIP